DSRLRPTLLPVYASRWSFGCGPWDHDLSFHPATLGLGRLVRPSHPALSFRTTAHVFVLSCMSVLEGLSPSTLLSFLWRTICGSTPSLTTATVRPAPLRRVLRPATDGSPRPPTPPNRSANPDGLHAGRSAARG